MTREEALYAGSERHRFSSARQRAGLRAVILVDTSARVEYARAMESGVDRPVH